MKKTELNSREPILLLAQRLMCIIILDEQVINSDDPVSILSKQTSKAV
jgi:hypothetical protein